MIKKSELLKDDSGIENIVGTLLLLVVTVVIAAMIAAYVLPLISNSPQNKLVAVSVKRVDSSTIYVKTMGGEDVKNLKQGSDTVRTYLVMVNSVQASTVNVPGTSSPTYAGPEIGSLEYYSVPENSDVTIFACFTDNSVYPAWASSI